MYVPPELTARIEEITGVLAGYGINLVESTPIQYGKQLKVAIGPLWAEVNVFFGKKGFSVVKTLKTGSNGELADMTYQILYETLCN